MLRDVPFPLGNFQPPILGNFKLPLTMYAWKAKYGGLNVSEAQRLRQLEDENRRLKKLVADLSLDKDMLQAVIRKNGWSSQG